MLNLSDDELVVRCKRELPDDTRSFEVLVQRHMNRVYSLVYRLVCNKEEAEDLTQEVFVKVFNNLKKFDQKAAFTSWLYRIATNTALDALDKTKRKPQITVQVKFDKDAEENTDLLSLQADPTAGPEEATIQQELRECISRALKKLEKDQARMLVLRDFDDLSYDEIAKLVGTGLGAVKMRIHRSRLAFQEVFNQFCGKIYLAFTPATEPAREAKAGKLKNKG